MKPRFPLYAKLLSWFFLNLLLLGIAGLVVIGSGVGFDLLLHAYAGDRIRGVTGVIATELRQRPASEWDAVLRRHSESYRVKFLLYRIDGTQLAGEAISLPREVQEVFSKISLAHRLTVGRNIPDSSPRNLGKGEFPLEDDFKSQPPSWEHPRHVVRTSGPTRYWVTVPANLRVGPLGTSAWLIVSDSLDGGGLFFDVTPLIVAGSGVMLLSALFWFPLVRGITRSIGHVTRATEQIAQGRFDVRVPARRRDELGHLGQAVNSMAERIEGFVTGQKQFLGDIAHELCSPLARAQVAAGILEQHANESSKSYVQDVQEEVQHMSDLVDELLSFSKASLGKTEVKLQPVNMREVAARSIQREAHLGSDIRLEMESCLTAAADPDLVQRALANLLRNATRYAGDAGPITVFGRREADAVLIGVSDCGPGVPEESLRSLFDPFYRVDHSRMRETGGVGLGLTIVKTCIEACGGSVICRNRKPSGLEVVIRLKLD